jgi:hypothetical protein
MKPKLDRPKKKGGLKTPYPLLCAKNKKKKEREAKAKEEVDDV